MTVYKEDDYLLLSGLQHFAFLGTAEGSTLHKLTENPFVGEKRGRLSNYLFWYKLVTFYRLGNHYEKVEVEKPLIF